MRTALAASILCMLPLTVQAVEHLSCKVEVNGETTTLAVPLAPNALGGQLKAFGKFSVRTLLAAPPRTAHWLLVEVYAEGAEQDHRIISSQKVFAPFATGRVEVVEPQLGRSLRYTCKETK